MASSKKREPVDINVDPVPAPASQLDAARMALADLPAHEIPDLRPAGEATGGNRKYRPTDRVLCVNRCNRPLKDMFNSREFILPPGPFYCEHQQAMLFKKHQVVPGTRDGESRTQDSWIGIIGIDADADCEPFTDEQCAAFGAIPEAMFAEQREIVPTAFVQRLMKGAGAGGRMIPSAPDISRQATPEASARAAELFTPTTENYAIREMQIATLEAGGGEE